MAFKMKYKKGAFPFKKTIAKRDFKKEIGENDDTGWKGTFNEFGKANAELLTERLSTHMPKPKDESASPFNTNGDTDPPESAQEQYDKINQKRFNELNAIVDSLEQDYKNKMTFTSDSLDAEVNKDVDLYNQEKISKEELKKRRPGVKFENE